MRRWTLLAALLTVSLTFGSSRQDIRVQSLLQMSDLVFEVDEDHDYMLTFPFTDGRSQTVYIISDTKATADLQVREFWSFADRTAGPLPAEIADRLMQASNQSILGSWQVAPHGDGRIVALVYRTPTQLSVDAFKAALQQIAIEADAMEKELTGEDHF